MNDPTLNSQRTVRNKMNACAADKLMPVTRSVTTDSNLAIQVDGVSKCYLIYDNPQDRLKQAIAGRLHALAKSISPGRQAPAYYREFWALRDISFTVQRGEAVGIVGRNGAGKSTLLQIIAGTLTPTVGTVEINGTVAALLELGSGFSPEFTGRENVYLNASLLGLSRAETDAKFEEIAGFADIGEFIDQPVKTYSSGMLLRLAFAVQTAVDPKILIVDEALAVGDMFFQAKCMARLRRLMSDGVTILFVSHDIGTVRQLCSGAVFLNKGTVIDQGPVQRVTDHYQRLEIEDRNRSAQPAPVPPTSEQTTAPIAGQSKNGAEDVKGTPASLIPELEESSAQFRKQADAHRSGNGAAEFINVQILKNGTPLQVFDFGDVVTLRQVVRFNNSLDNVNCAYKIRTLQGTDVVFGDTRLTGDLYRRYETGSIYVFEWTFKLELMHGNYAIMSGLAQPPQEGRDDWIFLDMVPTSLTFSMAPRKEGMIGGLVVWNNCLHIRAIDELPKSSKA